MNPRELDEQIFKKIFNKKTTIKHPYDWPTPMYSYDAGYTINVIQEMLKKGYTCEVAHYVRSDTVVGPWCAVRFINGDNIFSADNNSYPIATCLAALKAIEK
tara:strand:+ start:2463 stop:2768 length:306 start_codon:yes stop_codon:yes gene_type:complete